MVAAVLTAGLTSGATIGTASAAGAGESGAAAQAFAAKARQAQARGQAGASVVTLITGDRVHVDGQGRVTRVQPAKGREDVRMKVNRVNDQVYVLPADAAELVSQGTLDRRLFNVTGLLKAQYDDAHRATLPLIVSYAKNANQKAAAKAAIADADVSVRRTLPAVSGEALTAPKDETADVWEALTAEGDPGSEARETAPGIERVWLDGKRQALLDKSVPQIGAPTAWGAGYDGTGVKIAVLDTGVDQTHPDLKGVEIAQKDFSDSGNTTDHFGHGTHVASIAAGSGAKSGGKYKGVAPGAKIIDAKVLDDDGFGEDSGIIAGMQWAVDQGAKIANLSLGGEDTVEADPLEKAVDKLSAEKGVLFVIAAGNEGPSAQTVGSPGSAASALTVGAVDSKNRIADFSSVGPTADGSLKPDITAPGVDIVAAKAAKGFIGDPAADGYVALSGTSMATPHVAGAAALLAQQHPDWTGARIKQALTASAKPTAGLTPYQQGTGRADLTKAIAQTVVSEQTSLNFGTQSWPHTNDKPVTKTVTYANTGTQDITLDLSLETVGPKGKAAPAGFFSLGAQQVTVPAGGTASVGLTSNTSVGSQDGAFGGSVVAKATEGGQSVRTSFGAIREVESYDITVKFIDAKGKPSKSSASVYGHSTDFWQGVEAKKSDGVAKIRLPKGSYLLEGEVATGSGKSAEYAWLVQPKLAVTKNSTVTFDARKAKPISITAPDSAKLLTTFVNFNLDSANGGYASTWMLGSFKGFRVGQVGPSVSSKLFSSQTGGTWQKGGANYNLLYNRGGSFYTGFTHKTAKSELATVNTKVGASVKKRKGYTSPIWIGPSGTFGLGSAVTPLALPGTVKNYVTTPKGFTWAFGAGQLNSRGSNIDAYQIAAKGKSYAAKKTYTETFNVGVFAPKVGGESGVQRYANEMLACIAEFSDGAGHLGFSKASKQQSVLSVNGKKLVNEKTDLCLYTDGLPAKSAKFTVSTDATRATSVAGVSTRLKAAWTFTSKAPAADKVVNLPVSTVGFAPKLTLASTAPAGKKFTVPLTISGPAAKNFKSLAVQVSYDGGKKWSKAPVTTKSGKRSLALTHPKKAKSVSFKAKLTDKSGNTYDVTVVKAYLLK
ncbi:S8 family peptidase [Streptomyces paludis]|uniref:1,4-dihydropyridine esterase n=1 Tax=Streptomyces paludis TaxID=2282738 RepID=A0A345I1Y9_9ACTN|nr:S8 family peptidase [Streptomyces paludis]AXG82963.1 1,4-dihydropyridine esterase [Streptomyces paludis]